MREKWLDYTKGILIILVVLGHILPPPYAVLSTPASYIFLFHIPNSYVYLYLHYNKFDLLKQIFLLVFISI